jgi:arylsulfatase A-like enzyme
MKSVLTRSAVLRLTLLASCCLCLKGTDAADRASADRPNILWISCEDISAHLGCYGDPVATTPNLDRLSAEGTRYTHAFSCHGVCAPSRTGIITGMSPISLGANHMRSKVRLPDQVKLFPEYLREAGYYCTNNSKTDYNLVWDQKATWDESSGRAHWKNRPNAATPFFAVFNLTMTHESKVWPSGWKDVVRNLPDDRRHNPADVTVPALFPDTPAVREDLARIADLITVMDQEAGRLLKELDDAGLAEDTIVMFWSDHGNGLPRFKRWTYDSGSHVPLIVKVPEKYHGHSGVMAPGSIDDRMINLIDLGPTVLNLAGIARPEHMQGQPFLGPDQAEPQSYIYGARDRIDERFDLVRTVRSRQFRYVRNLMPWRPALQHVQYGEQNETLKDIRRLLADGKLSPESAQWFHTPRPAEELYDLKTDPWEVTNLADRPEHQATLEQLRAECDAWQLQVRDAHLLPEIMLDEAESAGGTRWQILQGDAGQERCRRLLEVAKASAFGITSKTPNARVTLDADPAVRWWQLTQLARGTSAAKAVDVFHRESQRSEPALQIAAAAGLVRCDLQKDAAQILKPLLSHDSPFVRHAAILEIDEAGQSLSDLFTTDLRAIDVKDEYFNRLKSHVLKE